MKRGAIYMLMASLLLQLPANPVNSSTRNFLKRRQQFEYGFHKRVLVVVRNFPTLTQTFVIKQIKFLLDYGFDVKILSLSGKSEFVESPIIDKYNLLDRVITQDNRYVISQCGIILCQFGTLARTMLNKGLVSKRSKLAVCFRGYDVSILTQRHPQDLRTICAQADLLLPVSDYFRNILIKNGADPEKVNVVHSAIDGDYFDYIPRRIINDSRPINILTVGRLTQKKGHSDAIRAVAKMVQKYPTIRYTIVGEGIEKEMLHNLIEQLGMTQHIFLVGGMQHSRVRYYFSQSDIFLLASRTAQNGDQEGIPSVIYEAMASGVPVVSTNHAGISEIITSGLHGLLASQGNVDQIAQYIDTLISSPDLSLQCAAAARDRVVQLYNDSITSKRLCSFVNALSRCVVMTDKLT